MASPHESKAAGINISIDPQALMQLLHHLTGGGSEGAQPQAGMGSPQGGNSASVSNPQAAGPAGPPMSGGGSTLLGAPSGGGSAGPSAAKPPAGKSPAPSFMSR